MRRCKDFVCKRKSERPQCVFGFKRKTLPILSCFIFVYSSNMQGSVKRDRNEAGDEGERGAMAQPPHRLRRPVRLINRFRATDPRGVYGTPPSIKNQLKNIKRQSTIVKDSETAECPAAGGAPGGGGEGTDRAVGEACHLSCSPAASKLGC